MAQTLTEQQRAQLDTIVQRMEAAGEPEDAIRAVVSDFKATPTTPKAPVATVPEVATDVAEIDADDVTEQANQWGKGAPGVLSGVSAATGTALQSEPLRRGVREGVAAAGRSLSRGAGSHSVANRIGVGGAVGATLGAGVGGLVDAPFAGATVGAGLGSLATSTAGRSLASRIRAAAEGIGTKPAIEASAISGEFASQAPKAKALAEATRGAANLAEATGGETLNLGKAALAKETIARAGKMDEAAETLAQRYAKKTGSWRTATDAVLGRRNGARPDLTAGKAGKLGKVLGPAGLVLDTVTEQGSSDLPFQGGYGHRPANETAETTAARQKQFEEEYRRLLEEDNATESIWEKIGASASSPREWMSRLIGRDGSVRGER